jgi:hypothetical protein
MGLFNLFKKNEKNGNNETNNLIYELLFCDNLKLFKSKFNENPGYPWDILFNTNPSISDLQKIISDNEVETRCKILAYNILNLKCENETVKKLMGVIIEVGQPGGTDALAVFNDGRVRYINQSGAMIFLEFADDTLQKLINELFQRADKTLQQLGPTPWDKPRLPKPSRDMARISFLTSSGLFFGHGANEMFFSDPLAGPVLETGVQLLANIMKKANAEG